MALYKDAAHIEASQHASFDSTLRPGAITPNSAIYRCTGCGREIVSEMNKPMPAQNQHQHPRADVPILWKMLVYAQHDGS